MKAYKKLIFYIAIIIVITVGVVYFYPKKINREYSGIMYRLGNIYHSEKINININGYISKGLLKGDKFEGTINIGDKQLPKLNMRFDEFRRGTLFYYNESIGEYRSYGTLISDDTNNEFTILVLEEDEQKNGGSSWNGEDGLMISAPANSRNEALEISTRLMEDIVVKGLK